MRLLTRGLPWVLGLTLFACGAEPSGDPELGRFTESIDVFATACPQPAELADAYRSVQSQLRRAHPSSVPAAPP